MPQPSTPMPPGDRIEVELDDGVEEIAVEDIVVMQTASGSEYRVVRDGEDRYWLQADNVANPMSRRLDPDTWWHIEQPNPWPPELGRPIQLCAPEALDRGDPDRLPGGGKITSPVRATRRPK